MASSLPKKHVPKGVRLGWASLKEARSCKVTVDLTSIKGVKVKKTQAITFLGKVNENHATYKDYLIP